MFRKWCFASTLVSNKTNLSILSAPAPLLWYFYDETTSWPINITSISYMCRHQIAVDFTHILQGNLTGTGANIPNAIEANKMIWVYV